jgi:nicotinate-nucleotide adenylyltransferase
MDTRIGVLGGTFNPVHLGHLHIAFEIQRLFSLSQVHFVVATLPPHKALGDLIALTHRYAMVSLATAGIPKFVPSLVELEPEASPFSVDTMDKLARQARRKKNTLYFIAGGDSLAEVGSWRESERLLNSYSFIFAVRPGAGPVNPGDVLSKRAAARVRDLRDMGPGRARRIINEQNRANRIYIVDVGAPAISATRIRQLTSSGKSIDRMVPGSVRDYIGKLHLYGGR